MQTPDDIMEILADDQMKHAEAPADAEMEAMYHHTMQEEIIAANKVSALEADREAEAKLKELGGVRADEFLNRPPHRNKFTFIGYTERKDEALQETQRRNVESSQVRSSYHE